MNSRPGVPALRALPESGKDRGVGLISRDEVIIVVTLGHFLDGLNRIRLLNNIAIARTVELVPRLAELGHAERRIVKRIRIHGQVENLSQPAGGDVIEKPAPGQACFNRSSIATADREAARPGYAQIQVDAGSLVVS